MTTTLDILKLTSAKPIGDKKTLRYQVKEKIENITGEKLREITGSSRFKLTLQTRNAKQTSKSQQIESLACENYQILPHRPRFNTSKGLIRLKQFDIDDMQELKENLQDQYDTETAE